MAINSHNTYPETPSFYSSPIFNLRKQNYPIFRKEEYRESLISAIIDLAKSCGVELPEGDPRERLEDFTSSQLDDIHDRLHSIWNEIRKTLEGS